MAANNGNNDYHAFLHSIADEVPSQDRLNRSLERLERRLASVKGQLRKKNAAIERLQNLIRRHGQELQVLQRDRNSLIAERNSLRRQIEQDEVQEEAQEQMEQMNFN